jgi:[ribosomal protein S5]-alanine N-acetyltransferase
MNQPETERLLFRRYEEKDKEDFVRLFTDESVMKYVDKGVLSREQAEAFWLKLFAELYPQDYKIWAVFKKEDSGYIGHAGIYRRPAQPEDWEFVYFLNPEFWGKGYATEIARKVVGYGFEELNLPEIYATVDDEHAVSIRVLEKAGMNFLRYEYDAEGRYSVYSIKAAE